MSPKALEDELEALKAELLVPNPSVPDRVFATVIIVDYLAFHRAALAASTASESVELRNAHDRLSSMAQKRLRESLNDWDLNVESRVRGKPLPATLKIFSPDACTA